MKFNPELVQYLGSISCACIADIIVENRMPQILFSTGVNSVKQIRMVLLDNEPETLTKEQIVKKIEALKAAPGKDNGFSYTQDNIRVIIVPEEMSIHPVLGAPLGTPQG